MPGTRSAEPYSGTIFGHKCNVLPAQYRVDNSEPGRDLRGEYSCELSSGRNSNVDIYPVMTFEEILEHVIQATGHERYRFLCGDESPDKNGYRSIVINRHFALTANPPLEGPDIAQRDAHRAAAIGMATGKQLSGIVTMAGNAIAAAGRVVKAVATGEQVRVSPEERDRRWGLCMTCPNLVNDRCKLCGCHFRAKIELATERCPIGKWDRVTEGKPS